MKKIISAILAIVLALSLTCPALATVSQTELEAAADYLQKQGIMVGDENGNMHLDQCLTRAELATILTRMTGNPEHVTADQALYVGKCTFTDVPQWAKVYVGYCAANGLMLGYGGERFGASDKVTPDAACTVILRYLDYAEGSEWNYWTACQTALDLGLTDSEAISGAEITRGGVAILLYRTLRGVNTQTESSLSRNADGSINLPSDGSQYVPQAGDVIRCDDGTNYTITDVSLWNNSMFANDPTDELPAPTCDWSSFPEITLPTAEARHFSLRDGEYLFLRNLYETRRMQYVLMNLSGTHPDTSQSGRLRYGSKGTPYVSISLTIPDHLTAYSFWPWRESELTNNFNSCPPGKYYVEAWDVFKNGKFLYTEYKIATDI